MKSNELIDNGKQIYVRELSYLEIVEVEQWQLINGRQDRHCPRAGGVLRLPCLESNKNNAWNTPKTLAGWHKTFKNEY